MHGQLQTRTSIRGNAPRILTLAACLLLAACGAPRPVPPPVAPAAAPEGFPAARYAAAAADGGDVYAIDPAESLVTILAYRAGALARMGHDHVVASRDVRGFVLLTAEPGGERRRLEADLYAPLDGMTVDEETLRAAAGFTTEVSDSAKEGTRANMLASLEAATYPFVVLTTGADLPAGDAISQAVALRVAITLHGVTREFDVPAVATVTRDRLTATGRFSISQADFGIEPYSVLGGALAVRNDLDLEFRITAARATAAAR